MADTQEELITEISAARSCTGDPECRAHLDRAEEIAARLGERQPGAQEELERLKRYYAALQSKLAKTTDRLYATSKRLDRAEAALTRIVRLPRSRYDLGFAIKVAESYFEMNKGPV